LLDLIVERTTLRRLSAEQGEKAGALATQALRLLAEAVELGLLFCRGVLVAFDLFRLAGIDRGTAIDGGELAFEPQAHRVARAATRPCVGNGRTRSGSAWRRRGAERKTELRRRRGSAQDERGQGDACHPQDSCDRCAHHGAGPTSTLPAPTA